MQIKVGEYYKSKWPSSHYHILKVLHIDNTKENGCTIYVEDIHKGNIFGDPNFEKGWEQGWAAPFILDLEYRKLTPIEVALYED